MERVSLDRLKAVLTDVPPNDLDVWFKGSRVTLHDDALVVEAAHAYADFLDEHFGAALEDAFARPVRWRALEIDTPEREVDLNWTGIPNRLQAFDFARAVVQGRDEGFPAFRDRVFACQEPTVGITPWNGRAAAACRDFAPADGSLVLVGPVGVGKSTLIAAAGVRLARQGVAVNWFNERSLVDAALADRGFLARLRRVDVLALDDLGSEVARKDWKRDLFERVICDRYDDDRPVLATSNLAIRAKGNRRSLATVYGERVASRLEHMTRGGGFHTLVGFDWRTGRKS